MRILITGGAGFIGSNCAAAFANNGHEVVIFDNLSRLGSERNLSWIKKQYPVDFIKGDIREFNQLVEIMRRKKPFDLVLHLAAQVAVTTSVEKPHDDFQINASGTFNLLEAIRSNSPEAVIIYASTNKVYGGMEDLTIVENNGRYVIEDLPDGVDEGRNLDFHSPYGCSKGSADQYCRDYARIYGLKTVIMRMSCIYGYRQFGVEDQGWVAWFCIAAALGKPITIYGDGKQVRDVLFIDDLLRLYELAYEKIENVSGSTFNIGGGPKNTLSLLELIEQLEELSGKKLPLSFDDWRPGDQPVYVSNTSLAETKLGWKPEVAPRQGVEKLYHWVAAHTEMFE
jgi:CDP-paratose 2-epimerase